MPPTTDVAIIGVGPYGLSIAAHLRMRGVNYRIFGSPMHSWMTEMPKGMHLKSEGFASNIYDPKAHFTLKRFCDERGTTYADIGSPVPLETFITYGLAFQKQFVPEVENKTLTSITPHQAGFALTFANGESVVTRRVVIAIGLSYFRHIPETLAHLPSQFLTHSADYGELDRFRGRRVIVIGGGASAIDIAGLLGELGADVHLVARSSAIKIHDKLEEPRPLSQRIKHPMSGIGPGWRSLFYSDAPGLFYYLPEQIRVRQVKCHPPVAAGWFMKDYMSAVAVHIGFHLQSAKTSGGSVTLQMAKDDGSVKRLDSEHIIAATGYQIEMRHIPFLTPELRSKLKLVEGMPQLSTQFQSSVPGLYFVGPASANTFGPVMRFAVGAKFTANRLSKHLAATSYGPLDRKTAI